MIATRRASASAKILFIAGAVSRQRTSIFTRPRSRVSANTYPPGDQAKIIEIIWSLIVQGVLVPGLNDANEGWPFLRLTDYGRRCLAEERLLPHDPDGFLLQFTKEVPSADSVIVDYLEEALQCFLRGQNRAAAVMLGGASEKAVLLLFEAYGNAITNPIRQKKFFEDLERANSIFRKYEIFDKRFATTRPQLPIELQENVNSLLRGVFDLIRSSRNDAGHPTSGVLVDRDTVYSHLRLFVPYCKRIYGLIDWLSTNRL